MLQKKQLVEKGSHINTRSDSGTAPQAATNAGHYEVAEFLWGHLEKTSASKLNPFVKISQMMNLSGSGPSRFSKEPEERREKSKSLNNSQSNAMEDLHSSYNQEDYFNELQGFCETGNVIHWNSYIERNILFETSREELCFWIHYVSGSFQS